MNWREAIAEQSSRGLMWFTFGLGAGSAVYFSLSSEPSAVVLGVSFLLAVPLLLAPKAGFALPILLSAGLLSGFGVAGLRTHLVAAPKLASTYSGLVEGTVFRTDQSFSGAPRVWLKDVKLDTAAPPPDYIRLSFPSEATVWLKIGTRIQARALLSPPQGKTDPDGYDFQRAAWFLRLGAVGYARDPPQQIGQDRQGFRLWLDQLRQGFGMFLDRNLSQPSSGFAKALLIGDRSSIDKADLQALRDSNLAHLLAISGLHMGLLTALFFGGTRLVLVLAFKSWDARWIKKLAAGTALVAGLAYLGMSGFGIATQRAFVMIGVMLMAILVDRPAISLRSLTLAALILLLIAPENILNAGFQMSFAATSALVVGFEAARPWFQRQQNKAIHEGSAVILSSFLAGLATAPVAAFHFNRIAYLGLPANLLTVPLMGFVIIPGLLLGSVFQVIGLGWVFFGAAEWALEWVVFVAHWTSDIPNAVGMVQASDPIALAVLATGWTVFAIWKGPFRWTGLLPCVLALILWSQPDRPDILISGRSGAVGVLTDQGRAVNKDRAAAFEILQWLENDGSTMTQEQSAALWPQNRLARFPNDVLVYSSSKRPGFWIPCDEGQIVIAPKLDITLSGRCTYITKASFRKTAAIAVYITEKGAVLAPTSKTGRLWQDQ